MKLDADIKQVLKIRFSKEPSLLKEAIINNKVSSIDWERLFLNVHTGFTFKKTIDKPVIQLDNSYFFCIIENKLQRHQVKKIGKALHGIFDYIRYYRHENIVHVRDKTSNFSKEIKLRYS